MSIYATAAQVKNKLGANVFIPSFVYTILYTLNNYQSKLKDILLKDLIHHLIFRRRKIVTIYSVDKMVSIYHSQKHLAKNYFGINVLSAFQSVSVYTLIFKYTISHSN